MIIASDRRTSPPPRIRSRLATPVSRKSGAVPLPCATLPPYPSTRGGRRLDRYRQREAERRSVIHPRRLGRDSTVVRRDDAGTDVQAQTSPRQTAVAGLRRAVEPFK